MSNRLIFFSCFAKYSLRSEWRVKSEEWRESKSFFIFTLQSPLFTLLYSDFESTFQIVHIGLTQHFDKL